MTADLDRPVTGVVNPKKNGRPILVQDYFASDR
jgi:hypothetical protein